MNQRKLFIAAYDIKDAKRLRRALKVMRGYASGGQKSVFECFLTSAERSALLVEIETVIDPGEDRFFLLRAAASKRVLTLGKAVPPQNGDFYYIG